MPAQDRLIIHIRITPELLKRLKVAAAKGERSLNAEVVTRLERSFSLDSSDRDEAIRLLAEVSAIIDRGKSG